MTAGRGAVLVMHDITELRKADLIRRDFVANVSHELRTPLTAIKGYAEALLDDPEDADARERFLEIIHRQAERMERLVKDLLRLARLEAGQETVEVAPCDIAALVRGIVADFEPTAAAKQQTIAFTVAPGAAMLETDAAKLHDIIRNLVENAVNYTPEGGAIDINATVAGRTLSTERGRHRSRHCPRRPGPGVRTLLPRRQIARRGPAAPGSASRSSNTWCRCSKVKCSWRTKPTAARVFTINLPYR